MIKSESDSFSKIGINFSGNKIIKKHQKWLEIVKTFVVKKMLNNSWNDMLLYDWFKIVFEWDYQEQITVRTSARWSLYFSWKCSDTEERKLVHLYKQQYMIHFSSWVTVYKLDSKTLAIPWSGTFDSYLAVRVTDQVYCAVCSTQTTNNSVLN